MSGLDIKRTPTTADKTHKDVMDERPGHLHVPLNDVHPSLF